MVFTLSGGNDQEDIFALVFAFAQCECTFITETQKSVRHKETCLNVLCLKVAVKPILCRTPFNEQLNEFCNL